MTIWLKKTRARYFGNCYEISSEYHDAYIYKAETVEEAVAKYEADRHVKVTKTVEVQR